MPDKRRAIVLNWRNATRPISSNMAILPTMHTSVLSITWNGVRLLPKASLWEEHYVNSSCKGDRMTTMKRIPSGMLHKRGDSRLAIDGGAPVRSSFLPFGAPCLGEEEIAEVVATLRSGWIGTGPKVQQFEEEFAAYIGAPYAVAVSSCTAGLFLSLVALGIGSGDEVITTPLTFAATVNVIEHVGARPVLVDIDPHTLNIDPEQVERAVTPRTKAIIPVHFGGLVCPMEALQRIARTHNLVIVEDAAHAVGARLNGQNAGSFGAVGAFSFYANKSLTTAE